MMGCLAQRTETWPAGTTTPAPQPHHEPPPCPSNEYSAPRMCCRRIRFVIASAAVHRKCAKGAKMPTSSTGPCPCRTGAPDRTRRCHSSDRPHKHGTRQGALGANRSVGRAKPCLGGVGPLNVHLLIAAPDALVAAGPHLRHRPARRRPSQRRGHPPHRPRKPPALTPAVPALPFTAACGCQQQCSGAPNGSRA